MNYTLVLEDKEAQVVIDALVERPFKDVNIILNKVISQIQSQQKESNDASNSNDITHSGT